MRCVGALRIGNPVSRQLILFSPSPALSSRPFPRWTKLQDEGRICALSRRNHHAAAHC